MGILEIQPVAATMEVMSGPVTAFWHVVSTEMCHAQLVPAGGKTRIYTWWRVWLRIWGLHTYDYHWSITASGGQAHTVSLYIYVKSFLCPYLVHLYIYIPRGNKLGWPLLGQLGHATSSVTPSVLTADVGCSTSVPSDTSTPPNQA